jgi:integrase
MARKRGQNEGSIFRRADGRWCGAVSFGWKNGRRVRRYIYRSTAEAVRRALTEIRSRLDRGEIITDQSTLTLAAFANQWLANIAPDLKPRTVLSYRQLLECHIVPRIGTKKLREISRSEVKGLITEKRKSGLSKNTVRLIRACISALFAEAVDEGLASINPPLRSRDATAGSVPMPSP